ncbi:Fibronectin type III-like domain [Vibrio sp. B1FLJ16]|uniref:fibronectin type III-like domain-contianing protein n=1 Tax=Vibrio sp. B1FLJ16 TaxID=2751178 RepID=UPI001AFA6F29|nr:fibronectin type III-like domain-contianing protein [Vibrio sp. B1FLJ16]CAD7822168.1 Fibronectin type III-like domain [Vibrio sp. B1FLJ16]CAE6948274.1 Fibronectin type III-like domain [Vibrio sp. B1FLJ16]
MAAPEVKLKKPTIELKAFNKTALLKAGQSETLSFDIPANILASFDTDSNQWIVEPGAYTVYVAPSSDVFGDFTGSAAPSVQFTVNKEIVVSKTIKNALSLEDGITEEEIITIKE